MGSARLRRRYVRKLVRSRHRCVHGLTIASLLASAAFLSYRIYVTSQKVQSETSYTSDGFEEVANSKTQTKDSRTKLNVLLLWTDDLRRDCSPCVTSEEAETLLNKPYIPNLERLASRSLVFTNAYNQCPLCNPSRTSVLTGRRPDTTHVYHLALRNVSFITMPEYFKLQGYHTLGMGKVTHGIDDPRAWSEPSYLSDNGNPYQEYWLRRIKAGWLAVSEEERQLHPLPDDLITDRAIERLRDFAGNNTVSPPFFMAVGLYKPHTPVVFPSGFLQHYPRDAIRYVNYSTRHLPDISLNLRNTLEALSAKSVNVSQRLMDDRSNEHELTTEKYQAYYSALSYMDHNVGRILDELDRLHLSDNTVIVFLTDHGVNLGEHAIWGKNNLFDTDTRSPMMLSVPGLTDSGVTTDSLVELVDLFPSVVEAAGLPSVPQCSGFSEDIDLCHEGTSVLPLVLSPAAQWKMAAFSQAQRQGGRTMGYSIRTSRFRYTEWVAFDGRPIWSRVLAAELYDYHVDPGERENLAGNHRYGPVRQDLRQRMRAGWREALPEHLML